MLTRLEAKGVIRHREEGLRYVYTPTLSRASASRKALGSLVGVFFGGSPSRAAAALLHERQWSDDELDALKAEIDRVKQKRRTS
jgi:predicted transcriptional regulator